ncbi:MAG: SDR family oxidoreductase [Bradymonadia bacterium]
MAHTLDFTGKRVLVTGGSGDIGRALCAAFAGQGARVGFTYFSSHEGQAATEAAIREARPEGGPEPTSWRVNLKGKGAAEELAEQVQAEFGGLDIFISNAASGVLKPATELTGKHWDWTLTINAKSFLGLTGALAPLMSEGGRIMALSSAGATRAIENYAAIGASKAALESLVRHFAMELGPKGITVNALCPGVVDTQALDHFPNRDQLLNIAGIRTPNGRIATPTDVAEVALLVASPLAGMIQGQTINIDGGYGILA